MEPRAHEQGAEAAPDGAAGLAMPRFELPPAPRLSRGPRAGAAPAAPARPRAHAHVSRPSRPAVAPQRASWPAPHLTATPAPAPAAPAPGESHGHSHGDAPCSGHGHTHAHSHAAAPAPAPTPTPAPAPVEQAPAKPAHGHSHGGTPCSGHGHAPAAATPSGHGHGHAHAHGHSHAHAHSHGPGGCEGGHGLFDAHTHDWSHLAMQPHSKRMLKLALYVQGAFLVLEVVGGIVTNSLALLSDAAHMLADVGALALALLAAQLAARAVDSRRTWGMPRAEMLAAAFNSFTLVLSCVWIAYEAIHRLLVPEGIDGAGLIGIATAGLLANILGAWLLSRADKDNVNIRAAMLHLLVDAASSVGVIVAGVVISLGGPVLVDTVASILIAVLAVKGTWPVLRQSLDSLLDAAPDGVTATEVVNVLRAAPGVTQVHDVHVWEPGPRRIAATAHVLVAAGTDIGSAIMDLRALLARELGIDHATLQVAEDRSSTRHAIERVLLRDDAIEQAIRMVRSARPSFSPERVRGAVLARAAHVAPEARTSPVRLTAGAIHDLER